jgi:hypothetical protein
MNVSQDVTDAIASLDLEPIKNKLIHHSSDGGWTRAKADAVALAYRRFLHLARAYPDEVIAPSVDVDKFWHQHILDTARYAADCARIFGYFLHHNPYLGLGMEEDDAAKREQVAARTCFLHEQTFGERACDASEATQSGEPTSADLAPAFCATSGAPAFCAAGSKQAFCAVTAAPAFARVTAPFSPQTTWSEGIPLLAESADARAWMGWQTKIALKRAAAASYC